MAQEIQKIILVIEDEATYQRILKERLGNEGFAVLSANDGEKGLA